MGEKEHDQFILLQHAVTKNWQALFGTGYFQIV